MWEEGPDHQFILPLHVNNFRVQKETQIVETFHTWADSILIVSSQISEEAKMSMFPRARMKTIGSFFGQGDGIEVWDYFFGKKRERKSFIPNGPE